MDHLKGKKGLKQKRRAREEASSRVRLVYLMQPFPNLSGKIRTPSAPGPPGRGETRPYRMTSSPFSASTVRAAPGETWSAMILRESRVSTVCCR